MTQEEQNNPEEMRKVMRMMQVRMRNIALHHFDRIGIRTLRSLQDMDLFDDEAPSIGRNVDVSVLKNSTHPRRTKLSDGPLVLYVTQEENPKRIVVELPVILFSESQELRKTAMECIEEMIRRNRLIVTPKTKMVLDKVRTTLMSDDPRAWRRAAVSASDVLYDDVLLAFHGTRQSLECEPAIQDSLNFYTPRMVHPTISSLDSISLDVGNPERGHDHLTNMINDIAAHALSLQDVCAIYYDRLGFLPFAPEYSMAMAVHQWLSNHSGVDVWAEVWKWVDRASGPLPLYHACAVFILYPELVPAGKLPDLWDQILRVIHESGRKSEVDAGHEAWALRRDLARHYCYHLEARLPDNDGASISCFAWWFSEKVASLFPDNSESARFYREHWVKPATDLSSHIWLAASAPIQQSFLRYATFTLSAPWAVALLAIMGKKLDDLAPNELAQNIQVQFHDDLVLHVIGSLPFPVESPSNPTFALECSMADTVLKWAAHQPEKHRKALEQLVETSRALGTADGLCEGLRKLAKSPLADQVAIALALKAKAYTDPAVGNPVWEVLSDPDWRQEVLGNVETRVLGLLIEAFSILQVDNGDKWFSLLPHFVADLCEKAEDEQRRRELFLYVLHTSIASDTVSAVRRLLRGEHKAKFVGLAKEYRDRMEAMRAEYPAWVAGKLRGLIANLHVV